MLFGEASSVSQLAEAARELIERTERTHREFRIILALLGSWTAARQQAQDKGWSTYASARARLRQGLVLSEQLLRSITTGERETQPIRIN